MPPNKYYRFISKSIWLTALILFIAACSNDDPTVEARHSQVMPTGKFPPL